MACRDASTQIFFFIVKKAHEFEIDHFKFYKCNRKFINVIEKLKGKIKQCSVFLLNSLYHAHYTIKLQVQFKNKTNLYQSPYGLPSPLDWSEEPYKSPKKNSKGITQSAKY